MTAHVAIPIHKMMRTKLLLGASFAGDSGIRGRPCQGCLRAPADRRRAGDLQHRRWWSRAADQAGERVGRHRRPTRWQGQRRCTARHHAAVSFNPKGKLRPGEYVYVCCVACDRDQAGLVLQYIKGNFEAVPAFAKMIVDSSHDTITLRTASSFK